MILPAFSLGSASSLFVALIVLLRLIMVTQPMNYQRTHKAVSRISCIVISVLSLLIPSIEFILSLPQIYDVNAFRAFSTFRNAYFTVPVPLTILIYAILLCFLNRHTATSEAVTIQMKTVAKMTHGVVVGLLLCNVPGLIFCAYVAIMDQQGRFNELFKSNTEV